MLYYYAHSGHQFGLERVRRGVVFLKELRSRGFEVQLLVNDFRAGLACKDWGGYEYVTIETIQDIDAIAMVGDDLIIDSPEDDHGRVVKFCSDFKNVWRFSENIEDKTIYNEKMITRDNFIVDKELYRQKIDKKDRVLFFLGDSDYKKTILNNSNFFKEFNMDLLLGSYFFVKYEKDLEKIFNTLHEAEDYVDTINSSKIVVTSSVQTAVEAKFSGAKVIYLNIYNNSIYNTDMLEDYGITIVNGLDVKSLKEAINSCDAKVEKSFNIYNIEEITTFL